MYLAAPYSCKNIILGVVSRLEATATRDSLACSIVAFAGLSLELFPKLALKTVPTNVAIINKIFHNLV